MRVTIPAKLRETLLERTAPAYLQYPGQAVPQKAYIALDLRNGSLNISHALLGEAKRMDEYGRIQQFPISPYVHGPSLLTKLEELLPDLQSLADLLNLRWDGSNMRYFLREGVHRMIFEDRDDRLVRQLENLPEVAVLTPDWYNPRDFLREMPTASPAEIAREIVDVFQGEFPLNDCDYRAVEETVRDALQRCILREAPYTTITFPEEGGVFLQLGDGFRHLYDKTAEAAKDYLRYVIDGFTPPLRGLFPFRPDGSSYRGDEAETHVMRADYVDVMSDRSVYHEVGDADQLEFFRLLRLARGLPAPSHPAPRGVLVVPHRFPTPSRPNPLPPKRLRRAAKHPCRSDER